MTSTPVARDYLGKRRSPLPAFVRITRTRAPTMNLNFKFIVIST
jgi:hypothetical protein